FWSGRSFESEERIDSVPDFVHRFGDRCNRIWSAYAAADCRVQFRTHDNHLLMLRPFPLKLEVHGASPDRLWQVSERNSFVQLDTHLLNNLPWLAHSVVHAVAG